MALVSPRQLTSHSCVHTSTHTHSLTCACAWMSFPVSLNRSVGPWPPCSLWCGLDTVVRWPLSALCTAAGQQDGLRNPHLSCKGAVGWQVSMASTQWLLPLPVWGFQMLPDVGPMFSHLVGPQAEPRRPSLPQWALSSTRSGSGHCHLHRARGPSLSLPSAL